MSALAGQLWLRPGTSVPHSLRSSRRDWAAQLAPGRPASALPGLLATVFNLCGQAHHSASTLALAQAAPGAVPAPADHVLARRLQRDTALAHLHRLALDWPRLLPSPGVAGPGQPGLDSGALRAQAAAELARCPLLGAPEHSPPWAEVCHWLQQGWLQMTPATWLRAWQAGGAAWLDDWSRRHPGWLAGLLRALRQHDTPLPQAQQLALRAPADAPTVQRLGDALARHGGPALPAHWPEASLATGPWCRLHALPPDQPWTAWSLLGSRLVELVRLCLPDVPGHSGAGWLAFGARATGPGQGLAWVEMARGLLVHQVQVSQVQAGQVQACQVLVPTDWNFHPHSLAAQALAGLDPQAPDLSARVQLLVAALDPCVPYSLAPPLGQDSALEAPHA